MKETTIPAKAETNVPDTMLIPGEPAYEGV